MAWYDFFTTVPEMDREGLRDFKKGIDSSFRDFSREFGESIEAFFDPVLYFLVWLEKLFLAAPWPVVILVVVALAWLGSRSIWIVLGTIASFIAIAYLGMWEDTMSTLAIISVATTLCIAVGIPLGILMARSDRLQAMITPILDIMQTIPAFV